MSLLAVSPIVNDITLCHNPSRFWMAGGNPCFPLTPHMISQPALIRKGVFKNFSIFFRRAKWRRLDMQPIYIAHIGIMIRAYSIVFPYCQARVYRYFFIGKILRNTPPHPCPPSTLSPLDQNSPLCNPRAIQLPWLRVTYFYIDL